MEEKTSYQRLATVQCAVAREQFNASGHNKYRHYNYMELGDFLPFITVKCAENNLFLAFDFSGNTAILDVKDALTGETVTSCMMPMPMPLMDKDGQDDHNYMQKIGANITYAKRYLVNSVFLVSETSYIDSDEAEEEYKEKRNNVSKPESRSKPKSKSTIPPKNEDVTEEVTMTPEDFLEQFKGTLKEKGQEYNWTNINSYTNLYRHNHKSVFSVDMLKQVKELAKHELGA